MSDAVVSGSSASTAGFDFSTAELALASSSTSKRIAQLQVIGDGISQGVIGQPSYLGLVQRLFATHGYYQDRHSRLFVQRCLVNILKKGIDEETVEWLAKSLRHEGQKAAKAPSAAFVLVEWCGLLLQHISGNNILERFVNDILLADTDLLEICLQPTARKSVSHSALVTTRRGLRKLLASNESPDRILTETIKVLTAKAAVSTAKNAPMLGVIAGVSARQSSLKSTLQSLTQQYYAFYTRELVGSKGVLEEHIAVGLRDFFHDFATIQEIESELMPSIEKGLLRSPEVVLSGVLMPLLRCLPDNCDVSGLLENKLLKPILSNAKSSNPDVRAASLSAFRAAVVKCHTPSPLQHVTEEIAAPLKAGKLTAPEHRILHSQMLEALPLSTDSAETASTALIAAASKEGNELALSAETSALAKATSKLFEGEQDLPKSVLDGITKGLADKKPTSRRLWLLLAGALLKAAGDRATSKALVPIADALVPKLISNFNEVLTNPSAAAQNGLIGGAYVLTAMQSTIFNSAADSAATASLRNAAVSKHAIDLEVKQPYLLSYRIFSKITAEDDLRWQCDALSSIARDFDADTDEKVVIAWSQSFIHLITAPQIPPRIQQEATTALSSLYVRNPSLIAQAMIAGLWDALLFEDAKDRDFKFERASLINALKSFCLDLKEWESQAVPIPKQTLEQQACSILVLARQELIPRSSWIDLCLRMGLDPGDLARKYEDKLLGEIGQHTSPRQIVGSPMDVLLESPRADQNDAQNRSIRQAAYNSAAELAFVAPETILPRLIELLRRDLDATELRDVGPVEAAIFRTPEGTCFVDVLAKKSQNSAPNKNTKDYDILKWEEELRSHLEQKKGQQRKLTPEETAKVNTQLKKEADIRKSIQGLEARLTRGIGVIEALASGPPTDATLWLGSAVKLLLAAIDAGAHLVIADVAYQAYISCSQRVTERLGVMRSSIGFATLRLRGASVPEEFCQESLEDLVTRVLYRLRFISEQRPLDAVSLTYVAPLILDVLRNGGVAAESDDKDAQVVLAIELVSFHTDVCADESVPRDELLTTLVEAMQTYTQHYKLIKDCFADLCRCVAPNMSSGEIKVLERGSIVPQSSVRNAVLQSLSAEVDMSDLPVSNEIWIACHDDEEEIQELGKDIWDESGFKLTPDIPPTLIPFAQSKDGQLRRSAARALSDAAQSHPSVVDQVLQTIKSSYFELSKPKVQQLDEYGMPKRMDLSDPWEARHGIATIFQELAAVMTTEQVDEIFNFLIEAGPLGDRDSTVRAQMLDAAIRSIEIHGKSMIDKLMSKFEHTLEQPDKGSEAADRVNEAVIIMYGALARHLKAGDKKIPVVIDRLVATLSTPSETVQFAIAECLPPLIRVCPDKASKYFEQVTEELLNSKKYASQRGAAYGLAGLILGRGIVALREFRILSTLKGAVENKKESHQREAGLIAFELLSTVLGRLFEPYVIQVVPQLLSGFGDSNADVRDACLAAAKACFGKLSSYGVKKIMPTLLYGLEDDQWRSKRGACELLGAMAYLDPEQLANSLPDIIPPLTAVLNDSHKEVRGAANRSLKRFGDVITNPEIKGLVGVLLKALSDPTKYTDESLDALIKVQFVHYLDAPSLALVTRILQRGLGDRSNTKRKAAQVIGSLAHLTEKKDILTHLPVLITGLKVAAVDPVPTTRATASRALGSLVEKLGEDSMPDLIPGLMQTLKSDTGAGDRLGSAQALSEVLAGLGTTRLEETLPTILQNVESSKPAVREGFMSLFIFLPVCFGNSFSTYLGKIIPPILSGLADDIESIRETALRAGRLLVKNFAVRAVDLLLPELERGLADDSYRIRLSSVELVGDLLFNLTGIKADAEGDDEEDEDMAKEAGASLREALGEEKRNKILSALYVCRCDTANAVRAAAVSVWKALVHSPRILKELVPTLTQLIIRRLGSSNMEHKVIASNALGELIRKAGDGVLASLLPTLEEGLQTSVDTDAKQGICLALRELISSAAPDSLEDHEKTLISVVRKALTDSDEEVREAAAEAFDSLQQIFGKRAVDQVLPFLLNLLRSEEDADNALSALLTLLTEATRSSMILPNLIPTLITPPITSFDAKALASLSKVAGASMNRRLPNIINSLLDNEVSCKEDDLRDELTTSFDTVIQSIDEYDGLNTVMNVLLGLLKHEDHRKRAAIARHMGNFFSASGVDYSRYNQDIIRSLLNSFDDSDLGVVKAAWEALSGFTKKLRKEEMESLVVSTRQTLQRVGVAGANLHGFELPKGINAVLPIFLQGLMNGTADQRVAAALGISDIVDRTSEASLKPFVTQITGPLIRVVSERATEVKSAILLTLNNLLEKMPTALKPFLPQLQRTFAKSLADPSSETLRSRAAKALGTLIRYTPRVDPLIAELVTGSKTSDPGVRTAMLKALYEVISKAGANMGEPSRAAVLALIDTETDERVASMTVTNAKLLGALTKNVPGDAALVMLRNRVVTSHFTASSVLALNAVLVESPEVLMQCALADELPGLLCQGMTHKNVFIADNFILATGKVLLSHPPKNFEESKKLFETLAKIIPPENAADSRRLALMTIRTLCRRDMDLVRPHVPLLAPVVFAGVRDLVIPVKLAAEAAFVELFNVADEESRLFDKFMAGPGADLPPASKRSMSDYFKRVALRLGKQAQERRDAEGGQGGLGLSNDEVEDETEIWSVGKVEVSGEEFGV